MNNMLLQAICRMLIKTFSWAVILFAIINAALLVESELHADDYWLYASKRTDFFRLNHEYCRGDLYGAYGGMKKRKMFSKEPYVEWFNKSHLSEECLKLIQSYRPTNSKTKVITILR